MAKIKVTSSSSLLSSNKAWEILRESNELFFSDYADWSGTLMNAQPDEVVAIVLFVADFSETAHFGGNTEVFGPFFNLLKLRLQHAQAATIVIFSSWQSDNLIRAAKATPSVKKIHYWLNSELDILTQTFTPLYKIDLDEQIADIGYSKAFDNRNWYSAHCRLSLAGLNQLVQSLSKILLRLQKPASKILVLDCDNTIWGGVVGEDGSQHLVLGQDGLGQAFVDFQQVAKKLTKQGLLLALCSKNNEADVWEAFNSLPAMVLKKNDLVAWKINWQEKASNIQAFASELDLGVDSFVFWDDNPLERDKMRNLLPQVYTVDPPLDVVEWASHLNKLDCFSKFNITEEDREKTVQYHTRAKFISDKSLTSDEQTYLQSIRLKPKAVPLDKNNMSRAAQLCAKTNQYNLRTIRHTEADLLELTKDHPEAGYLVNLSDIYGDHGLVGLVCLKKITSEIGFLDTFLMSCRVLGRHLEAWMLNEAISRMKKLGYTHLVGEWISTQKNSIAQDFFIEYGFTPLSASSLSESCKNQVEAFCFSKDLWLITPNTDFKIPYMDSYENH